jgi:hypothetical protein
MLSRARLENAAFLREAHPGKQLRQVSLQSVSGLLQHGNGQVLIGCQTQVVAVVADLSMGPPGASGGGPLMMSSEVARPSHKPKRGLLCHPGKPLWGIRFKGEPTFLGTDHHILSLLPILDARDDMSGLARRLGGGRSSGTRARSRGCGPGWTLGRALLRGRGQRAGGRVKLLLEQGSELSHLLLERGNLCLQGAQRLRQGEESGGQWWQIALHEGKQRLGERSQAALMQASQQFEVLLAHPFFASVAGMALQGEVSIRQPAAQGFGIDAEVATGVSQRDKSHGSTPFVRAENENEQDELQGNFPGVRPGKKRQADVPTSLAGLVATSAMVIPSPILMGAPEAGPLTDQGSGGGRGEEQAGQQMMDFGTGQGNEGGTSSKLVLGRASQVVLNRDAHQEGRGEQHEGDVAIPAEIAADFILIQAQLFTSLQVLFDVPPRANGLHDGGELRGKWGPDEIKGQLSWVVETATDHEEVASVHGPGLHPGEAGPVEKAFAFGALALAEPLPVAGPKVLGGQAGHVSEEACLLALHTDDFGAGDGERVGVALLFQPLPQVRAVAVDRISHDPADGQVSLVSPLDHALGQFGFGAKADGVGNMGGVPAR